MYFPWICLIQYTQIRTTPVIHAESTKKETNLNKNWLFVMRTITTKGVQTIKVASAISIISQNNLGRRVVKLILIVFLFPPEGWTH